VVTFKSIKKLKENVASKSLEFENKYDNRSIKLFFQDEARFCPLHQKFAFIANFKINFLRFAKKIFFF